jgi:hypothetical protein
MIIAADENPKMVRGKAEKLTCANNADESGLRERRACRFLPV